METDRNYARFFMLLKKMPGADKESIVSQYTCGRTTHLHETTPAEYATMCQAMERITGEEEKRRLFIMTLKKQRSVCLKLMQKMGVDTTNWQAVDNLCMNPRIAGQKFAKLSGEELGLLERKLRAIQRNGGFKPRKAEEEKIPHQQLYTVIINQQTMAQS